MLEKNETVCSQMMNERNEKKAERGHLDMDMFH